MQFVVRAQGRLHVALLERRSEPAVGLTHGLQVGVGEASHGLAHRHLVHRPDHAAGVADGAPVE